MAIDKAPEKKRERILRATPAEAPQGASDLEVMHPARILIIDGSSITMREYGFIEGLGLLPQLQPFIDELEELLKGERLATIDGILPLFGRYQSVLLAAVATACDQPDEWVKGLGMQDGYSLVSLWWAVNGPFFMRTAVNQVRDARLMDQVRAGQMSTPSSSTQATEQPQTSGE